MLWSEASPVCNGRIEPVRPFQPIFYPLPIRVLGPLLYDGSCEGSHHLACLTGRQYSPPHLGGAIDHNPLRRCILTGTDLLAYAEQCRMNSSDAGVAILTSTHTGGLCRATHQSACNTGVSYLFSGETFWAIMYYISRTAAMDN